MYELDFLNYHIAKIIHYIEGYLCSFNFFNNILQLIFLDYNIVIIFVSIIATSNFSNSYIFTELIPDFLLF